MCVILPLIFLTLAGRPVGQAPESPQEAMKAMKEEGAQFKRFVVDVASFLQRTFKLIAH